MYTREYEQLLFHLFVYTRIHEKYTYLIHLILCTGKSLYDYPLYVQAINHKIIYFILKCMDVIDKTSLYTSSCIHMDKYKYISDDYSRIFL